MQICLILQIFIVIFTNFVIMKWGDTMNAIARKQSILKILESEGSLSITELADELAVSTMTIRRDLNALAEGGLVTVEHGGAVLNGGSLFECNMSLKQETCSAEKLRIAQKCLEFINPGDSIFLDAGTTVAKLASLLNAKRNIIVLTHSLLVANQTASCKNIRVIMCPGELRPDSLAFMGPLTDEFVSGFTIDTLFLGVEGIDAENGISVPDVVDGATKKNLIHNAKRVICLADSSKFGASYFYRIAPLSKIDLIITDTKIDPAILEDLQQRDIPVLT